MAAVTISPKYQIVIPKSIRTRLRLEPGQKVEVFFNQGRIELVPVRPIQSLRGILKGIDTHIDRDGDRV